MLYKEVFYMNQNQGPWCSKFWIFLFEKNVQL